MTMNNPRYVMDGAICSAWDIIDRARKEGWEPVHADWVPGAYTFLTDRGATIATADEAAAARSGELAERMEATEGRQDHKGTANILGEDASKTKPGDRPPDIQPLIPDRPFISKPKHKGGRPRKNATEAVEKSDRS